MHEGWSYIRSIFGALFQITACIWILSNANWMLEIVTNYSTNKRKILNTFPVNYHSSLTAHVVYSDLYKEVNCLSLYTETYYSVCAYQLSVNKQASKEYLWATTARYHCLAKTKVHMPCLMHSQAKNQISNKEGYLACTE